MILDTNYIDLIYLFFISINSFFMTSVPIFKHQEFANFYDGAGIEPSTLER